MATLSCLRTWALMVRGCACRLSRCVQFACQLLTPSVSIMADHDSCRSLSEAYHQL